MYINDLEKFLKEVLPIHDVIAISGSTGIGKSEIIFQVAKELDMNVMEVRLYEEGESCAGLPMLNGEVTHFTKPYWFEDLLSGDYDILFLDDFHLVVPALQKYLYKLFTHQMLHNYVLKKKVKIIIAGNFDLSCAESSEIQSPIMSRIDTWVTFEPQTKKFIEWAKTNQRIDPRVIAYLMIDPDALYTADPPTTQKFPCPRTWEMLSKNIKTTNSPKYAPAIVGKTSGAKFIDFWKYLEKPLKEILRTVPQTENDKVRIAISLAYYTKPSKTKVTKSILDYVVKHLDAESTFIYTKAVYDNQVPSQRSIFVNLIRKDYTSILSTFSEIINTLIDN